MEGERTLAFGPLLAVVALGAASAALPTTLLAEPVNAAFPEDSSLPGDSCLATVLTVFNFTLRTCRKLLHPVAF